MLENRSLAMGGIGPLYENEACINIGALTTLSLILSIRTVQTAITLHPEWNAIQLLALVTLKHE